MVKKMKKFIMKDENFSCEKCGMDVKKLNYTARDHCPYCLYSKHVDINPGDREEECHGLMEPIKVEISSKKGYVILFRCKKCGAIRRCKAATDDDINLLIKYTANEI